MTLIEPDRTAPLLTPSKNSSAVAFWLFLTEPGLAPLLIRELKYRKIAAQKARATTLFLRNYDLVILPDSQVQSRSFPTRLALHVMACPVFGRSSITKAQLDRLADAWRRNKPDGLVSSIAGNTFQRQDLMRWLTKEMTARGITVGATAAPKRPVWLLAVDDSYYFGLPRFNYHNAPGRERPDDRSGSLPPVIAAALCFAAKPAPSEVIWDPVMGTGTVLREAMEQVASGTFIGSDIDTNALDIARKSLGTRQNMALLAGDSTKLDLGRHDLTLTLANLPFGKQFQPETGTASLYEGILRRSLDFAASSWRAVVLTSDDAGLRQAVAAVGGLALEKIAGVRTRGLAADIWLIARR
jgi:RMKL-like, methyltransferase domain